jgi:hypothetical protein
MDRWLKTGNERNTNYKKERDGATSISDIKDK